MRFSIYFFASLLFSFTAYGQRFCHHLQLEQAQVAEESIDERADTFDVLSYEINASFLQYQANKEIEATTVLRIIPKINTRSVTLDLLGLNVRGVKIDGVNADFQYTSPKLLVTSTDILADTFLLEVDYFGNPQKDAQWGGFYFTGEYAFNLGVGFAADPHNFGRVWFPCFDNFVDRATYHMNITVDQGLRAYGNGLLDEVVKNTDKTTTYKWVMDEPIPTYLAAVAIAEYEEIEYEVDGIPVLLTALGEDTANLRSSFENLSPCIKRFVEVYGEHSFNRVGFNIVPFNAGAMEHATNIAYPRYAIANGSKTSETLFAHELAHHWWGNTITCRTQEDMWLNEGWASYSERIFLEAVYGRDRYDEDVEDNHRSVLQFAHVQDGDVLPVSGIGHANTYGRHVYNKGADMVHSLRGMMGDEAFFDACRSFQSDFKFQDVTTDDMRVHFEQFVSFSLIGFFDQWVKTAGFPHFDILLARPSADKYKVKIKQTPRFNEEVYTGVRVYLSAFSPDFNRVDIPVIIDEEEQTFEVEVPFEPVYWAFDFDDLISDAVTTDWAVMRDGESIDMTQGMISNLNVNLSSDDSILIRSDHHWAPADGTFGFPDGLQLGRQRYWTVDGVWSEDADISGTITYSGLINNSPTFGYLDNDLIRITEDSLVLLYRPNASSAWSECDGYSKNMGSLLDKRGTIKLNGIKKGQYCLAMYDSQLANADEIVSPKFKLYPNPASDKITLEFEKFKKCCKVEVTNLSGQVVVSEKLFGKSKTIDVSKLTPGVYFLGVSTSGMAYDIQKVVIQ